MPGHRIRSSPAPHVARPETDTDADVVSRFVEDAAHFPGGHAAGVVQPRTLAELSACLREARRVLPVGAQSSLTGGATPMGDVVLGTSRLDDIEPRGGVVRAGAGVTLQALQDALAREGRWFPPVPTYLGATVGGAVATCAAGAATFKYGTVREWVEGITVVLAGGDVLEVERGEVTASPSGTFEIDTSSGLRIVHIPALHMPEVPKRSAGYFAKPGMDLVDLFIGSEGTLGVIADARLRTAPRPAALCRALVPVASEAAAIALAGRLRRASRDTWTSSDEAGIDIAAIEHMDARSVAILREDGVDRRLNITLPPQPGVLLLIEIELAAAPARDDLWRQIETAREAGAADTALVRFCRLLDRHGVLEEAEVALPWDAARAAAFAELREAVPAGVNRRIALARARIDARIYKTAADMIVPFDRFAEMMDVCRRVFADRGLDLAVWGHISDGNVHPNLIPRSLDDVRRGQDAIMALGDEVIRMGGCPLAEHGVGRSPIKQALLRRLYGDAGVEAMRQVKLSLDPKGQLAPGVIFPVFGGR